MTVAPTENAKPDPIKLAEVLPLIESVDADDADMLRTHPAAATFERFPFYRAGGLLRATARVPQPVVFRYVYLPDARRLYPTGTPELVGRANAGAGLALTRDVALTYLRYYLEVAGNSGWAGRRLAFSAAEVPWLPSTDTEGTARDARVRLSRQIHPADVAPGPNGGFRVTSAAIRGKAIEIVTFGITAAGDVATERVMQLTDDAPVVQVL